MDGSAGVVTLSWGGFRCRLEGFEDPMAVLAEAVEWLSGAEPETGRGPVTSRGAPPGVRREYRNGALVLRPAEPTAPEPPARAERPPTPPAGTADRPDADLGGFLGAAGGWSSGTLPGDPSPEPEEAAPEPPTAQDLVRMGLGPDGAGFAPATEAPSLASPEEAPGHDAAPDDAGGGDHREAVLRLMEEQHVDPGEAAPEVGRTPPPARRARRVVRPMGAAPGGSVDARGAAS